MKKAVILGVGPEAGLGSQLALRFAREGMHVLVASRTPSALEKLVAKIRESGGEATAVPTDATNEEQVVSLFENAGADLEVAVYNAGNNYPGRIVEMDTEYFENSWRVLLFGGIPLWPRGPKADASQEKGDCDLHRCQRFSSGACQFRRIQLSKVRTPDSGPGDVQGIRTRGNSRGPCHY